MDTQHEKYRVCLCLERQAQRLQHGGRAKFGSVSNTGAEILYTDKLLRNI